MTYDELKRHASEALLRLLSADVPRELAFVLVVADKERHIVLLYDGELSVSVAIADRITAALGGATERGEVYPSVPCGQGGMFS